MTPKKTVAQLRIHENVLLEELCSKYGYNLADTLGKNERSGMLMTRAGGKLLIKPAYHIKLIVPADGALGTLIAKQRKERDPATNKSARDRAKQLKREKISGSKVKP